MRLDHLLSKEHLTSKGVEEPASSDCGGGVLDGGDTGEVLRTAVCVSKYSHVSGVERWQMRFVEHTGILLGPETISAPVGVGVGSDGIHISIQDRVGVPAEAGANKMVWVWCWLRIAQWMRASLLGLL